MDELNSNSIRSVLRSMKNSSDHHSLVPYPVSFPYIFHSNIHIFQHSLKQHIT